VVWFTGLPSSGKSTLASAVSRALDLRGVPHALLDGDEVRAALSPAPGYGSAGRAHFYRTLAQLAGLLAHQGLVVLIAATGHRRAFRALARRAAPRYLEVYVATPLAECARRNSKGLYGTTRKLPGAGVRYEAPLRPDVRAPEGSTPEAVRACLAALRTSGASAPPRSAR
jgi:adenylylsulfate kinase